MLFKFESPSRDIQFQVPLGNEKTYSVAILGEPGSGKTLLSQLLFTTFAGPSQEGTKGLRGLFPALSWIDEFSVAELSMDTEDGKTATRQVLYAPYGEDGKTPNLMTYIDSEEWPQEPIQCAYVGGVGNYLFFKNITENPMRNAVAVMNQSMELLKKYAPRLAHAVKDPMQLTSYINSATPPMYSTVLLTFSTLIATRFARVVIIDFQNTSMTPLQVMYLTKQWMTHARSNNGKLIILAAPDQPIIADLNVFL